MRKRKTVIFVNGCFWHGHDCDNFRESKSNVEFWQSKIERNKERDELNLQKLHFLGFNVITIWECELTKAKREQTLNSLLNKLEEITLNLSTKTYNSEQSEISIAAEPSIGYGLKQDY